MIPEPSHEAMNAAVDRNTADARRISSSPSFVAQSGAVWGRIGPEELGVVLGFLEALGSEGHVLSIERLGDEVSMSVQRVSDGKVHEVRGSSLFVCMGKAAAETGGRVP